MSSDLRRQLGIEFPLFAFSHCRDVLAPVSRAGKHSRRLKSAWTEAWEANGPDPLVIHYLSLVSEPALRKAEKPAQFIHEGADELSAYWVGQGVGLMNQASSATAVVWEFKQDYLAAVERLNTTLED